MPTTSAFLLYISRIYQWVGGRLEAYYCSAVKTDILNIERHRNCKNTLQIVKWGPCAVELNIAVFDLMYFDLKAQ